MDRRVFQPFVRACGASRNILGLTTDQDPKRTCLAPPDPDACTMRYRRRRRGQVQCEQARLGAYWTTVFQLLSVEALSDL